MPDSDSDSERQAREQISQTEEAEASDGSAASPPSSTSAW